MSKWKRPRTGGLQFVAGEEPGARQNRTSPGKRQLGRLQLTSAQESNPTSCRDEQECPVRPQDARPFAPHGSRGRAPAEASAASSPPAQMTQSHGSESRTAPQPPQPGHYLVSGNGGQGSNSNVDANGNQNTAWQGSERRLEGGRYNASNAPEPLRQGATRQAASTAPVAVPAAALHGVFQPRQQAPARLQDGAPLLGEGLAAANGQYGGVGAPVPRNEPAGEVWRAQQRIAEVDNVQQQAHGGNGAASHAGTSDAMARREVGATATSTSSTLPEVAQLRAELEEQRRRLEQASAKVEAMEEENFELHATIKAAEAEAQYNASRETQSLRSQLHFKQHALEEAERAAVRARQELEAERTRQKATAGSDAAAAAAAASSASGAAVLTAGKASSEPQNGEGVQMEDAEPGARPQELEAPQARLSQGQLDGVADPGGASTIDKASGLSEEAAAAAAAGIDGSMEIGAAMDGLAATSQPVVAGGKLLSEEGLEMSAGDEPSAQRPTKRARRWPHGALDRLERQAAAVSFAELFLQEASADLLSLLNPGSASPRSASTVWSSTTKTAACRNATVLVAAMPFRSAAPGLAPSKDGTDVAVGGASSKPANADFAAETAYSYVFGAPGILTPAASTPGSAWALGATPVGSGKGILSSPAAAEADPALPALRALSARLFSSVTALSLQGSRHKELFGLLEDYLDVAVRAMPQSRSARLAAPCVLRTLCAAVCFGGDGSARMDLIEDLGAGDKGREELLPAAGFDDGCIHWEGVAPPGDAPRLVVSEMANDGAVSYATAHRRDAAHVGRLYHVLTTLAECMDNCVGQDGSLSGDTATATASGALELAALLLQQQASDVVLDQAGKVLLEEGKGVRRLLLGLSLLSEGRAKLHGLAIDLMQCLARSLRLVENVACAGASVGAGAVTAAAAATAAAHGNLQMALPGSADSCVDGDVVATKAGTRGGGGGGAPDGSGDKSSSVGLLHHLCLVALETAAQNATMENRAAALKAVRLACGIYARHGAARIAALMAPAAEKFGDCEPTASSPAALLLLRLVQVLHSEMDAWDALRDQVVLQKGGGSQLDERAPAGGRSNTKLAVATLIREAFALLAALAPHSSTSLVTLAAAAGQHGALLSVVSRALEEPCIGEEATGAEFHIGFGPEISVITNLFNAARWDGGGATQSHRAAADTHCRE